MAHPPGDCARVECTVDLGTQFCERCGRDRDSFNAAQNTYRTCPSCGAACCADCWNLVDGGCLACAPFRLADTTRPRTFSVAPPAPGAPAARDPYAELRGAEPALNGWDAQWGTARQRPKEAAGVAPASVAPDAWRTVVAASSPATPRTKRRRAGRIGLAAGAAWLVVAALAVVTLGASPPGRTPAPPVATPRVAPSPTATPTPPRATATPRPTRAPRATPRPTPRAHPQNRGQATPPTAPRPRATPHPTPRPTPRPVNPVIVAPPPTPRATARPTAAPTARPTPVATPSP